MTRDLIERIEYSNIYTLLEDGSAFFFEAGMMIDADGAYRAYHPDNRSGLDYLANAGKPGNWWGLVTDNGKKYGTPVIQGPTDPAPGFYVSATSLQDPTKNRINPRRYVDAESIPFIVLPTKKTWGASLGDFAVVIKPGKEPAVGAVFADIGPAGKIGEGSIALARLLNVPSSPKKGGVAHGIVYVVFPGTKTTWPLTVNEINDRALGLFKKWGDIDRLQDVMPEIDWS